MKTFLKVAAIILVSLAGLFLLGRWALTRAQAQANQPPAVTVEAVKRGNLVEFISAPGEVEPRARVTISARVAARIAQLPFREGDKVTKGDPTANPPVPPSVLVKLDDRELESNLRSVQARYDAQLAQLKVSEAQVTAAKARIDALRVALADAARELERNKKLLASADVSQATVDQLQTRVDQQTADIRSAEATLAAEERGLDVLRHNITAASAEIDKARENLSYAVITSPIDGVVTRLNTEVGELAVTGTMNNAGTVIMEVADLSTMVVKARVDENAIAQVKVGQKCRIRMEAYRDRVFEGTVQNVALANYDPQFDRSRASGSRNMSSDGGKFFKVEILLDTQGLQIFSGLTADVDIQVNQFDSILKVQSQCVLGPLRDTLPQEIRDKPEVDPAKPTVPVVYRLVNGQAVATPVTIGASDLTHTVIKSGLAEGDLVITGPFKVLESLTHGQKLTGNTPPATRATTTPSTTRSTTTQSTVGSRQ